MNRFVNQLISDATAPIGEMSARLFKKAVLFFLAMSFLFVSAIFLTIALFVFLGTLVGNTVAALSVGGLYLGAALVCLLVAAHERPKGAPAPMASAALMDEAKKPPRQRLEFAENIDETIAPILDILQEAGLERERLALQAGTEIAKQLNPFSLVAFAITAGFIIGRIFKQRNTLG
jgi:Putative Actinobacterial Holin-X, holin superfamily III